MSKKTNAAKLKARQDAHKPRKRAHRRKGRKNPAFGTPLLPLKPVGGLFGDPIFMHHLLGTISRTLELYPPSGKFKEAMEKPLKPDDFIKPEDIQ